MKKETYEKTYGWQCFIAALFLLGSIACFFLPFFSFNTSEGVKLSLTSWKIMFGGMDVFPLGGYSLVFNYKPNIALLIYVQVIVIAILSVLLSRNSPKSIVFSVVLNFVTFIGAFFVKFFLFLFSKNISLEGLVLDIGFYLLLLSQVVSLVLLFVCLHKARSFWRMKGI